MNKAIVAREPYAIALLFAGRGQVGVFSAPAPSLLACRLEGKSVVPAADSSCRGRRKMRRATERVGVAIALHEIAPGLGRERRIDIEF
jgi:hypothetical protein